ncbi:MAG: hypothetical protein LKE51_03925 [Selenomonas sp.]|jgi:predicted small integral membrane protein|nr:hypothetical protein [Selenomonas sp.]
MLQAGFANEQRNIMLLFYHECCLDFNAHIAVYAANREKGLVNAGFKLQQMDLWLSAHGIGACWLHMMTPDQENAMANVMRIQNSM